MLQTVTADWLQTFTRLKSFSKVTTFTGQGRWILTTLPHTGPRSSTLRPNQPTMVSGPTPCSGKKNRQTDRRTDGQYSTLKRLNVYKSVQNCLHVTSEEGSRTLSRPWSKVTANCVISAVQNKSSLITPGSRNLTNQWDHSCWITSYKDVTSEDTSFWYPTFLCYFSKNLPSLCCDIFRMEWKRWCGMKKSGVADKYLRIVWSMRSDRWS